MTEQQTSSIESWTLMSLIYRDMDDGDYRNALLLSERLFSINNQNSLYRFLYAKCLYHNLDYHASYTILKRSESVTCLSLFAKSCLEVGNMEETHEEKRQYWLEGVKALLLALENKELPNKVYWGDELSSVSLRHLMPSRASLYDSLGDLFSKLDNIKEAMKCYIACLKLNPYKISAFTKLCDIAPDNIDLKAAGMLPKDTFKQLDFDDIDLSKSPISYLPPKPSADQHDISFNDNLATCNEIRNNSWSLPAIRNDYRELSVNELKALVKNIPDTIDEELIERSETEKQKDTMIKDILEDIKKMKADEAYKSKHGLHKKPPTRTTQISKMDVMQMDEEEEEEPMPGFMSYGRLSSAAPRIASNLTEHKKQEKLYRESIMSYFLPIPSREFYQFKNQRTEEAILAGMNAVLKVLRILANGYYCQSIYRCKEAALTLQKLDDKQYSSARVLNILGNAYYHAGDYESSRYFFRHAFSIAPWYCESVPLYSTCLWYLGSQKERELNVLTFVMKNNRSHLFEAYIVAGNWNKLAGKSNEALQWFQKAVDLDASQFYGHTLLGYEEWEKQSFLQAKEHFAKSLIANKRSYMAWYGMASAYIGMEQFQQAASYLAEAIRLNPHNPTMASTMADIMFELKDYQAARFYIETAISMHKDKEYIKFLSEIEEKILEEQ